MKYYDNGCFHSVTVSAAEVELFKSSWPCSGLPVRSIWFQFDKRNGDLVDIEPSNLEENGADGSALVALSQDAGIYAKLREAKAKIAAEAKAHLKPNASVKPAYPNGRWS